MKRNIVAEKIYNYEEIKLGHFTSYTPHVNGSCEISIQNNLLKILKYFKENTEIDIKTE